jgi:hypothetical protein
MTGRPDPTPPRDDEATVRKPRKRTYGRPTDRPLIPGGGGIPAVFRLIALVCVIIIGVVGWFLMREEVPGADLYTGPASETEAARVAVRLADEAEILAHVGDGIVVFRFASNRRVLVLDFASLLEQGLMLNRLAALVEKVGMPRDRVLRDTELDAAISSAGDTMETYYFGHDYAAADLRRFFALADRDGIRLRPQEEWLRQVLRQEGMLEENARGAVISIPQSLAGHGMDAGMRAAILRHELSHAEYFTNPAYAEYARRFWRDELDEEGRKSFRRYLAAQGYDPANDDLMANETQAYLMHTTDARLFSSASMGVTQEVMDRWQAVFLLGMPNGWLRDACVASLPSAGAVLRRPRQRGQRPSVSTRTARVLTGRPRRAASPMAA